MHWKTKASLILHDILICRSRRCLWSSTHTHINIGMQLEEIKLNMFGFLTNHFGLFN